MKTFLSNRKTAVAAAGVLLLGLSMMSCSKTADEETASPGYTTQEATAGLVQVKVEGPAVVEANQQRDIRSAISGTVVYAGGQGEKFARGDSLVLMDTSDLENALEQAQLNLDQARLDDQRNQRSLDRAQSLADDKRALYDEGAISADVLSEAEDAVATAKYALDSSKIRVNLADLSLQKARKELDSAKIVAPYDGVVLESSVSIGDSVNSGTLLMKFADVDTLRATAEVDEYDIGKVALGMKVTVTSDVLGDETVNTSVASISPAAEIINNISVFTVSSLVDNGEGLLKPGMSADLSVLVSSDRGLVVPSKLVSTVRGRSYIDVLENGEVVTKRIEIGANDGINTAVLSGLDEGALVVVPSAPGLALPGASTDSSGSSIVPISVPGSGSR